MQNQHLVPRLHEVVDMEVAVNPRVVADTVATLAMIPEAEIVVLILAVAPVMAPHEVRAEVVIPIEVGEVIRAAVGMIPGRGMAVLDKVLAVVEVVKAAAIPVTEVDMLARE